jgi:pyridoxamine 5'-phosphate oxidase
MDSDLQELLDQCQKNLVDAVINPENTLKLFTVANVGADGSPHSRYVVLRGADFENNAEIVFFTDSRSEKIAALENSPKVSLCFFDRDSGVQLVMGAEASVHNCDVVSLEHWQATNWRSLQCYYMKEKPGSQLSAPFILDATELSEEEAYRYFTVIKCQVKSWDILRLEKTGNQRAMCFFDNKGKVQEANWQAP